MDDSHAGIGRGQLVGELRRAVGRGVVDDDQLVVDDDTVGDQALAHHAGGLDGSLDVVLLVPHRKEDGEQARRNRFRRNHRDPRVSALTASGSAPSGVQSPGVETSAPPPPPPPRHRRAVRPRRVRGRAPRRTATGAVDGRLARRDRGDLGTRLRRLRRSLEGEPGARAVDVVARADRRAAAGLRAAAAVRRPGGDGRGDAQPRPLAARRGAGGERGHGGDRARRSRPRPAAGRRRAGDRRCRGGGLDRQLRRHVPRPPAHRRDQGADVAAGGRAGGHRLLRRTRHVRRRGLDARARERSPTPTPPTSASTTNRTSRASPTAPASTAPRPPAWSTAGPSWSGRA